MESSLADRTRGSLREGGVVDTVVVNECRRGVVVGVVSGGGEVVWVRRLAHELIRMS